MNINLQAAPQEDRPLPLLRRDIKIYRGPDEVDGSPTYNCLDPVRAQYFKISWAELAIFQFLKPGMTIPQLTDEINKNSNLKVTPKEIQGFFEDAVRNNLLDIHKRSEDILAESERKKMHPIVWTLYHYLYIRVPILNPDHFLARTLHYVVPFISTPALWLYGTLSFIGIFFLVDRFKEFLSTFPYFFNFQGLIIYGSAITIVKVIHEFSHAYVAKFYRLHIPTMGIAFIVLWPVLYTDVTDGWKLNKRSQRLAISFAGIVSEMILAGLSTFGWVVSEPGLLQSVFFVVSSATWISTLAVNLNPAMRFDGYYILSDLIGIDNLQPRAFAFTRWQLRKWFIGLNIPPPEEGISTGRGLFIIAYSIYTWIYRITLYTVIAVFVYYKFTKALGILLFMVEIAFFIIPPFFSEARQLYRLAPFMTFNVRSIITLIIFGLLAIWFVFPFPHQERFPAITAPVKDQIVYVAHEGKVEKVNIKLDEKVEPGQILVVLSSEPLKIAINQTKADIEVLKAEIHVLSIKDEDRAYLPGKLAELTTSESKLHALEEQEKLLTIKAAISGTIYSVNDEIRPQEYIAKDQIIARIAPLEKIHVICFIPESKILDVQLGEKVIFRVAKSLIDFKGKIINIAAFRESILLYPALASTNSGPLPVVEDEGGHNLIMVESFFPVRIELEKENIGLNSTLGERGDVIVRGPWRSLLVDLIRYVESIYWRESGF